MQEIILKVTSRSLQYANKEDKWTNAQIAIISPKFNATKGNTVDIIIADVITLTIGDTHAIWYAHNKNNKSKEDYKRLFSLLENHPDNNFKFLYKVCDKNS